MKMETIFHSIGQDTLTMHGWSFVYLVLSIDISFSPFLYIRCEVLSFLTMDIFQRDHDSGMI